MFGITATARSSAIREIWEEIDARREEIVEEEVEFFDEKSDEWLTRYWIGLQDCVMFWSKKMPIRRLSIRATYHFLRFLVVLSVLTLLVKIVLEPSVDYFDFEPVAAMISVVLFRAGVVTLAIAVILYIWFSRSKARLQYMVALQEILAENYGLTSEDSDDINAYAVLMMAADVFSFKSAKRVRQEKGITEENAGERDEFVVGTDEDVATAVDVEAPQAEELQEEATRDERDISE